MFWKIALGAGLLGSAGALAYTESAKKKISAKDAKNPALHQPRLSPIAPPGVAQPPGVVATPVPPQAPDGSALRTAAQLVLTAFSAVLPSSFPTPPVLAFQVAYNATNPPVKLKADGLYGAKTAAALQSILTPANVPPPHPRATPSGAVPQKSPIPAAVPAPAGSVSVTDAANALAQRVTLTKASDTTVATFQVAYNQTPGVTHLVTDGKYGGSTQGALTAVLTWLGVAQSAPQNPFGPVVVAPAYPPGSSMIELDPGNLTVDPVTITS